MILPSSNDQYANYFVVRVFDNDGDYVQYTAADTFDERFDSLDFKSAAEYAREIGGEVVLIQETRLG